MGRQSGVQPNVISFNAAISACEKGGKWERALELLQEMRQSGVQPDVISFSSAISACESCRQYGESDRIYLQAIESGLLLGFFNEDQSILDLHDAREAVSQVIIRHLLQKIRSRRHKTEDIIVVTGQGKHSTGSPVLQQSVRSFLREVKGPTITEGPSDPGRFILTKESIEEWL